MAALSELGRMTSLSSHV